MQCKYEKDQKRCCSDTYNKNIQSRKGQMQPRRCLSSYCNHMMVHLFEIADYSLKGLTDVPQDVSCTSQARKWGILGEPDSFKEPIMSKVVFKYILFLREAGLVIQPLLF